MSRVGLKPINIPDKVQVNLKGSDLLIKGPKGEIGVHIPEGITVNNENKVITFARSDDSKAIRSLHGLTRALTANAVAGVTEGIKKVLKVEGVGYKVEMKGKNLLLSLGFSHPVCVVPPNGVSLAAPNATTIEVSGIDKQLVGETAANIRKIRKPEPYKGKGIRYENEYVRRKAGKTGA
ncbi:50S ribosomal protein L6 [Bacteroidetes/Chlorobi group bacterium ChocPot_Mid]|nr:MAG: 50S ribosomal protein L6 [Bacteroidetes/Chlorobi group bacterium ChocPot_Mid]